VDEEINVATTLLNANTKSIGDTTKYLQSVEVQLSELRTNLTNFLNLGGKFTPNRKVITQILLDNQRSILSGIRIAGQAQDAMVKDIQGQKESVIATLHHVASIMAGLVEQNQPAVETATQPPLAMQTVTGDCLE